MCGNDVWVIGGATVYEFFFLFAISAEIIEIAGFFAGDAYTPMLDGSWQPASDSDTRWRVSETGLRFRFRTYLKQPRLIDLVPPLEGSDAQPALGAAKFGRSGL